MRLLIADDHNLVRDALVSHVTRDNPQAEVLEASTFTEAREIAQARSDIDLILLDICMPGMGDLSDVESLIKSMPEPPVVLMSGQTESGIVEKAFACGARGFIPKTMRGKALVSVLQMIINGEKYVPDIMLDQPKDDENTEHNLSARELQVLEQLVKGQPNKRIAQFLHIEETTVKLHLRSIFKKLEVHNRTEAVIRALDANIISS